MNIKLCTNEQIIDAAKFAFERNAIEEYRCRPFLLNESYENIEKSYREYVDKEFQDILLQYENEELVGVTGIYWIKEDNYLSIIRGIFAEGIFSIVARNFIEYLESEYCGYKLYINTAKEHKKSIEFFTKSGFELLEDAQLYNLYDFEDCKYDESVTDLNQSNKSQIFDYLNTIITDDTYWNVERVSDNLDKFIVLGYYKDGIKGALYAQIYKDKSVEIFGMVAEDYKSKKSLIKSLGYRCKEMKAKKLILYSENIEEIEVAIDLGFKYYDSNVCFVKVLANDIEE